MAMWNLFYIKYILSLSLGMNSKILLINIHIYMFKLQNINWNVEFSLQFKSLKQAELLGLASINQKVL